MGLVGVVVGLLRWGRWCMRGLVCGNEIEDAFGLLGWYYIMVRKGVNGEGLRPLGFN